VIGGLLVLGVGLALLTPVFAMVAARRRWKAPKWLKRLGKVLSTVNATLYVFSFALLLAMVIWFLVHTK